MSTEREALAELVRIYVHEGAALSPQHMVGGAWDAAVAALAEKPAGSFALLTDEKDAQRYRKLRNASMDERNRLDHYAGPALDEALDAWQVWQSPPALAEKPAMPELSDIEIWMLVGDQLDDSMVKLKDVLPIARAIERAVREKT